jgi:DNA primase
MPRIADELIERLKQEIALERLAQARGIELTRHGADLIGRCPFHEDKTPSLVITPAKNLWHCLGACQAGGTVIDWVMRAEGVSFRHAVELLQNEHLPVQDSTASVVKGGSSLDIQRISLQMRS